MDARPYNQSAFMTAGSIARYSPNFGEALQYAIKKVHEAIDKNEHVRYWEAVEALLDSGRYDDWCRPHKFDAQGLPLKSGGDA